jgi:hypothetical protein
MRRSLSILLSLLFFSGWSASLFAATDHAAHGIDPGAFHLTLGANPESPRAGESTEVTLKLTDAYGAPVSDFEIVHEKRLHLIIVREGSTSSRTSTRSPGRKGPWSRP